MTHRTLAGLFCACALSLPTLMSCTIASVPSSTRWTIAGTAQFTLAGVPTGIKLGAFYYQSGSATPASTTPISNVVSLGSAASTPVAFSLDIDTTGLTPAAGDSIFIQMWDDTDGNGQMDVAESQVFCAPVSADPVFTTTPTCLFVFGVPYWYLGALPVQSIVKTGADIISVTPL